MHTTRTARFVALLVTALVGLVACGDDGPPGETYFDRNIQPILARSCSGNTAGCHIANPDDPFDFVGGNLDVSSFEAIQKRPDVLRTFGPYPVPLLLIKAVGNSGELGFNYDGEFRPLEVEHVGGALFQVGDDAYLTLLEWLENGATENGLPPPPPGTAGSGPCSSLVPEDFDDTAILASDQFGTFERDVQPILDDCSSGNCHGAAAGDFYVTCGDSDREKAWNYSQAQAFVDNPVDNSQVLNVPLAVNEGGLFHSGGEHFGSRGDTRYQTLRDWAESVGRVEFGEGDAGKTFFRQHVQPILVERGCSFEACHSPAATNDMKIRTGSQGFFAAVALERNYKILIEDFMALEVPDARRGRTVAKTILRRFGGLAHRGGPVLETPGSGGADPANCDAVFDPTTASAFCTIQEWVDIEREALIGEGRIKRLDQTDTATMVYVQRNNTTDVATQLEFDTYQPNSDLLAVDMAIDAQGGISLLGGGTDPTVGSNLRSLLDNCAGAGDRGVVDVSSPDVSPDGNQVTFAMRTGAGTARQVFVASLPNGATCTQVTASEGPVNGIAIHNFDPAWSPEGDFILFASTRGSAGTPNPTLSRQLFLPQSDIFRIRPDGSSLEQMTFLTNSEINPQTMREGRVIMTTEKVSRGFYQLAGRRINWDLTDYHPLLGQRADSVFADPDDPESRLPSVGYAQILDIREGLNGNFIYVMADPGAA
ncbi:MAG: PD40 domain-containing protein, partial [Deltaproteobacteria bacterium]|nr:PD40 domain-containing protein [Deltaproteobacteria bacterium]